ncbi:MAG: hypothetical protein CO128_04070 [Ignavibacteriales bacterium CG_4_9_14_3_um_filter_30_11]|nr:MAG: hypothetical protein CO128_04070 [Ignavibacteriales bacterium CG_4_9_14_3_um_filter_30_11]
MVQLIKNNLLTERSKKLGRPLILDGAMGSLLQEKRIPVDNNLWMSKAILNKPDIIRNIYKDYINSGADIITTNSFRTNPSAVKHTQYKSEFLVEEALKIAKDSISDSEILIAGSNPPAEDCYQVKRTLSNSELEKNHKIHIDLLMQNGCDFILNETQSHLDEIKIICEFCDQKDIPYILSLFIDEELNILSGENIEEILNFICKFNPLAVGFNCIKISTFDKIYKIIDLNFNWGLYLNCGDGTFKNEDIKCAVSPKEYSKLIKNYLSKKPLFIGACCGSSPKHIKKIKDLLNG